MTTFTFGGTALTTFGKVLLINDYLDMPPRRGEDILIPFRHGRIFIAKYFDARIMTFGFSVNATSATALESTLDSMRTLFGKRTEQTLAMTMEDASVRNATASVNTPLQIERFTNKFAKCVIEFMLADPLFRSSVLTTANVVVNASPKALSVTNAGTFEEREATITLDGPLEDVTITNSTNGVSMTYTGVITGSESVVISVNDTGEYTALKNGTTNVIGSITHSGSSAFMILDTGSNSLSITSDVTTTGEVTIEFYPPFL